MSADGLAHVGREASGSFQRAARAVRVEVEGARGAWGSLARRASVAAAARAHTGRAGAVGAARYPRARAAGRGPDDTIRARDDDGSLRRRAQLVALPCTAAGRLKRSAGAGRVRVSIQRAGE